MNYRITINDDNDVAVIDAEAISAESVIFIMGDLLRDARTTPAPEQVEETDEEKPAPVQPAGKGKKARKTTTCPICGKQGHIRKTCPKRPVGGTTTTPSKPGVKKLNEDQFDELKHLQSIGDLSSKDFAFDNDVPIGEVNRAISARIFEDHVDA
jgi:hypothetical protein